MPRSRSRRLIAWALGGLVLLAVLIAGGTWLYIHEIEGPAPAPLSLKSAPASTPGAAASTPSPGSGTAPGGITGSWKVSAGSLVGYRVNEVLAGQNNVAVGRTSDVTGTLSIAGHTVTSASFSVPVDTIKSDESQRDEQFNGRIMQTATYPTGTLKLTAPIDLGTVPAVGAVRTYRASATLTLHGQARAVTFTLQAERTSTGLSVSGSIPVLFARWNISNPSFAGFVTTQNHGLLEFLVKFTRA
jgi:polyisoprenoid-binding protein YceI